MSQPMPAINPMPMGSWVTPDGERVSPRRRELSSAEKMKLVTENWASQLGEPQPAVSKTLNSGRNWKLYSRAMVFQNPVEGEEYRNYLEERGYHRKEAENAQRKWKYIGNKAFIAEVYEARRSHFKVATRALGFTVCPFAAPFFLNYAAPKKQVHLYIYDQAATDALYDEDFPKKEVVPGDSASMKKLWDTNIKKVHSYEGSKCLWVNGSKSGCTYLMVAPLGNPKKLELSVQLDKKGKSVPNRDWKKRSEEVCRPYREDYLKRKATEKRTVSAAEEVMHAVSRNWASQLGKVPAKTSKLMGPGGGYKRRVVFRDIVAAEKYREGLRRRGYRFSSERNFHIVNRGFIEETYTNTRSISKIVVRFIPFVFTIVIVAFVFIPTVCLGKYSEFTEHFAGYLHISDYWARHKTVLLCIPDAEQTWLNYKNDIDSLGFNPGDPASMKRYWGTQEKEICNDEKSQYLKLIGPKTKCTYLMFAPLKDTSKIELSVQLDKKGQPLSTKALEKRAKVVCKLYERTLE